MISTQTSNLDDQRPHVSFDEAGNSGSVGGDSEDSNDGGDTTLEDAAEHERNYLRQRLREELGREPTEEELNEWLREHTEGY